MPDPASNRVTIPGAHFMRIGVVSPKQVEKTRNSHGFVAERACYAPTLVGALLMATLFFWGPGRLGAQVQEQKAEAKTPETNQEKKKELTDWEKVQLKKDDPVFKGISDRKPIVENPLTNPAEFEAFVKVLLHAHQLPLPLLVEHGLANVPYASLVDDEQRVNHLRSLLKIKGREVLLHKLDVPDKLKEAGVATLYQAWLEVENSPEKSVCVIFTDLPPELSAGSRIPHLVETDGFYFKLVEYPVKNDQDGFDQRYAPLLLARTLRVLDEEESPASPDLSEADRIKLSKSDLKWGAVENETPMVKRDANYDEYWAFNDVVKKTLDFPREAFAKYSRRNIVFSDMLNDRRDDYLRELVHVEGTLKRLRKIDSTKTLKASSPIKELYEGWIIHESNELHAIAVVLTELPPGLEPGEKMHVPVAFDGYYFKVLGYKSEEKNDKGEYIWKKAPLLIGRSVERLDNESSAGPLIPALIAMFAVIGVGVIGVIIWFRRGDRKVHQKTREALTRINPFGGKDTGEEPPLVEPGNAWNRVQDPPMP